jgi:hypothetical protein
VGSGEISPSGDVSTIATEGYVIALRRDRSAYRNRLSLTLDQLLPTACCAWRASLGDRWPSTSSPAILRYSSRHRRLNVTFETHVNR